MDLTNDDVADILALLDSLPYDALDLRTDRFHLTLRRTPGGWTEESELLTSPTDVTPEVDGCLPGRAGLVGLAVMIRLMAWIRLVVRIRLVVLMGRPTRTGSPWSSRRCRDVLPVAPAGRAAVRRGGDAVGADTVVAIIETMKLMNSVPAGMPGRVRICVENGEFAPLGARADRARLRRRPALTREPPTVGRSSGDVGRS